MTPTPPHAHTHTLSHATPVYLHPRYNDISTGDDGIAIKAGACGSAAAPNGGALQGGPTPIQCINDTKFSDGTYLTQNVTVRYNTFRIGMGISVGSESSGGIKDVFIHDNIIGLCEQGCAFSPGCLPRVLSLLFSRATVLSLLFSRATPHCRLKRMRLDRTFIVDGPYELLQHLPR